MQKCRSSAHNTIQRPFDSDAMRWRWNKVKNGNEQRQRIGESGMPKAKKNWQPNDNDDAFNLAHAIFLRLIVHFQFQFRAEIRMKIQLFFNYLKFEVWWGWKRCSALFHLTYLSWKIKCSDMKKGKGCWNFIERWIFTVALSTTQSSMESLKHFFVEFFAFPLSIFQKLESPV